MLEAGKVYHPCGVCSFVLGSEVRLRAREDLHLSLGSNQYKWQLKVKPGSRKSQQKAGKCQCLIMERLFGSRSSLMHQV
eukprot:Skav215859  [mRNA]  locus=scaffold1507:110405:110783:+ [translate_table: standard]